VAFESLAIGSYPRSFTQLIRFDNFSYDRRYGNHSVEITNPTFGFFKNPKDLISMRIHGGWTKQVSLVGMSEARNIWAACIEPVTNCFGEYLFGCSSIGHRDLPSL
jgi:hypothetical protein